MRFTPALRFFRRDVTARREPDPADLGTAFGMEASLTDDPKDDWRSKPAYELESAQQLRGPQEPPLAWLLARRAG